MNETDEDAWVLPIQDAGLFTHQVIFFIHLMMLPTMVLLDYIV